jgi:hypothetical protein
VPFNGSGIFQLVAGNPVVTGTVISSTVHNNTMSDIANNGLTNCIAKDGQTTVTADISFSGFKLTNVASAIARSGVPNAGQIQDGGLILLSAVTGTNTITATTTPGVTAYLPGQVFRLFPTGSNTGATTLNINSLGAKSITKFGAAPLSAGDIITGNAIEVMFDGVQFQLLGASGAGRLINVQIFTSSGTYTPTAGATSIIVEGIGGAGAGAGAANPGVGAANAGGPGGNGAWGRKRISGPTSQTITIGAGGTPTTGAGGNGTTTSFGALLTLPGGTGAPAPTASASAALSGSYGAGAGGPTGADVGSAGGNGTAGLILASSSALAGTASNSQFGQGGAGPGANAPLSSNGSAGGRGAGGGGGVAVGSVTAATGGAGGAGLIIVWEYS